MSGHLLCVLIIKFAFFFFSIGLDGCHLKGKYKCTLLFAVALDGNNGIILAAFAVVEAEIEDT